MTDCSISPPGCSPRVDEHSAARVGRPVDADGQATRARILIADRTTFADLGHAATTYRLLAESTGFAHSAAYDYFGSKAEPVLRSRGLPPLDSRTPPHQDSSAARFLSTSGGRIHLIWN
ncbi:MAG: TetR/AcrR family transcriptional regulator [Ilumatobacter sp.]|nr:TetR/AcrR family transcriptional regulator [Ilumatobacter sp.]